MLVFEDFIVREVPIQTLEELDKINVLESNNLSDPNDKVVSFALEKDMNWIAIANSTTVYLFDYSDGYSFVA